MNARPDSAGGEYTDREEVPLMPTIIPRADRIALPIPILYRRTDDVDWVRGRVLNISESGVLFGPTELEPGVSVEVILSPPIQMGTLAPGRQVCCAKVIRATEAGAAAIRLADRRFLLEAES
jgi:hypothetical protein